MNSSNSSANTRVTAALALILIAALYLTGLTRMGLYSTDEPRYADIGRTMARTGDWITPQLWGHDPWFEKPALLYWMTASGFKLGLGTDLAPRLPLALLSVGFLIFFWWRLRQLFDQTVASHATAILATSAGWLAYSHVAVTDLPVTAFFTAAVLFSLRPKDSAEPARVAAAIALGLAVLSKSVPPLLLFLPVLVMDRQNWRRWFLSWPAVAFLAVALPWHVLATVRNGWKFLYVLFIEQQFGRFVNSSRQHEQHWWFYAPVFLVLLFPWFPLLPLTLRAILQDKRALTLASIVVLGLVFFSAAVNKLPGYVLPLVPATSILMALGMTRSTLPERWLIAPIGFLGTLPLAVSVLPEIAAQGFKTAAIQWTEGALGLAVVTAIAGIAALRLRSRTFPLAAILAAAAFVWVEIAAFPALDQVASARTLWSTTHPECSPVLARNLRYGLYYYSEKELPDCAIVDKNATPFGGDPQTRQRTQRRMSESGNSE